MALSPVTLLQNPGSYNLAYGPNPVSLTTIPVSSDKYVLQLWDPSVPVKFADIRSNRNGVGNAIFDIRNLIQAYIEPSKIDVEKTDKWTDSAEEVFVYEIRYGDEVDGQLVNDLKTAVGFIVLGGRKLYHELYWQPDAYRPTVSVDGETPCTQIETRGQALTDWIYSKPASSLTDGKPSWLTSAQPVFIQPVRHSDYFTLSYLQQVTFGSSAPIGVNGLNTLRVESYTAAGVKLDDFLIPNILSNGGGPNTNIFDTTPIAQPYHVVTAGVGPANTYMLEQLSPLTHHYYVSAPLYNDELCTGDYDYLTDASGWEVYRFDLIEDNCSDYEGIQFSWMNSLGFRDYFTFQKKQEKTSEVQRNEYLRELADYNAQTYYVSPGSRGYTTYSQKIEQQWTANTRFLTDNEAKFLENLILSPDVKVRFGDTQDWLPVQLLTNSYTTRNFRKDRLFQLEVGFKLANDVNSQRG